jgi:hypothetical protein
MPQLQEMNHKHIAIAEYMLRYPSAKLYEIAAAVGLTAAWVSTVVNSELFRSYLMDRHKEIATDVTETLYAKTNGVAHAAVEKLGRMVDDSTDPDFILAVADRTMHRLGMAPERASVQVNNTVTNNTVHSVDPAVIAAAREKIHILAGVPNRDRSLPPAEGVQASLEHKQGEIVEIPAVVYQQTPAGERQESSGPQVREEGSGLPGR